MHSVAQRSRVSISLTDILYLSLSPIPYSLFVISPSPFHGLPFSLSLHLSFSHALPFTPTRAWRKRLRVCGIPDNAFCIYIYIYSPSFFLPFPHTLLFFFSSSFFAFAVNDHADIYEDILVDLMMVMMMTVFSFLARWSGALPLEAINLRG